ncbi:MAG TPA: 4-hydroxy-tetrahydrodipicolinate reductase [Bdellovibrionota bacterium]|nr:4-hydroxy-tetrahydrodipicolinate reductase [Bdellovibrionota bacterium]
MKPIRVVVLGALGRMGRAILDAMATDRNFHLKGAVVREKATQKGATLEKHGLKVWGDAPLHGSLASVATRNDVVIDVTKADAVTRNLLWAAKSRIPYVLAVTGLDVKTQKLIQQASKKIPIVAASNFSMGVAVLDEVAWIAAALLPEADIEIVESHHRYKKDAPSGTAMSLARSIVSSAQRNQQIIFGRPRKGERKKGSITIHSVRGGDTIGEHRIHLFLDGERIELTHIAASRAIFARGALRAARFVVGRRPGLYTMHDVLGLGRKT